MSSFGTTVPDVHCLNARFRSFQLVHFSKLERPVRAYLFTGVIRKFNYFREYGYRLVFHSLAYLS